MNVRASAENPLAMLRITDDERRARLSVRHRLAAEARATDAVEVAGDLLGLHATDPVSPFLAARARVDGFTADDLAHDLYERRRALRMLGMRRTMFVLPVELAPLVHHACSVKVAATNRRRLTALIESAGVSDDGDRWLHAVAGDVVAAVARHAGGVTAAQLAVEVPPLATKVTMAAGRPYGADVSLTNQVLTQLAAEGRIARGSPAGGWSSTRYRWEPLDRWGLELLEMRPDPEAELELARRWLRTYGPAAAADLRWWAGWTSTQVARALKLTGAVEVALDGAGTGYVLADDLEPARGAAPWIALLPALDPTAMGWQRRDWYLGDHREELFDRTGNIGPTIWADGRIVGGWAQRPDGEIAFELPQDVGSEAAAAIEREAAALKHWLGPVRFRARFGTPLELRLAGRGR